MQIINRKKVVLFNNFIWNIYFFTNKTVCKFLRSFTIPILSKIEITIDFNGQEGPTLSFKYSTRKPYGSKQSSFWVIMMIHLLLCAGFCHGSWWFMSWFVMICSDLWFVVIHVMENLWWFIVICGDLWWFMSLFVVVHVIVCCILLRIDWDIDQNM